VWSPCVIRSFQKRGMHSLSSVVWRQKKVSQKHILLLRRLPDRKEGKFRFLDLQSEKKEFVKRSNRVFPLFSVSCLTVEMGGVWGNTYFSFSLSCPWTAAHAKWIRFPSILGIGVVLPPVSMTLLNLFLPIFFSFPFSSPNKRTF